MISHPLWKIKLLFNTPPPALGRAKWSDPCRAARSLPQVDCEWSRISPVFWFDNESRGLCSVNEAERISAAERAQRRAAGRAAVRLAL